MNIAKLRTKAEGLVTQLTVKDECERVVLDAMSNKSWAAHPTQLNEIAEWTFQYDRCDAVSSALFASRCWSNCVVQRLWFLVEGGRDGRGGGGMLFCGRKIQFSA